MPNQYMNEDAVIACADLVGRCGASDFEIGYLHDDVPVEEAGWYAVAKFKGARLTADDHQSPTLAAAALSERLLRGAMCRCRQPVTMSDRGEGCRWRLVGRRWEPGCDAPSVRVEGERGDYAAMQRALAQAPANRAERRDEQIGEQIRQALGIPSRAKADSTFHPHIGLAVCLVCNRAPDDTVHTSRKEP